MRVISDLTNKAALARKAGFKSQSNFESKLRRQVIGNHTVRFTADEMISLFNVLIDDFEYKMQLDNIEFEDIYDAWEHVKVYLKDNLTIK